MDCLLLHSGTVVQTRISSRIYLIKAWLRTVYHFIVVVLVQTRIFSIVDLNSVWLWTVYYCIVVLFLQTRNYYLLFFCDWSKIGLYWKESTWLHFFQRNIIVCLWTDYIINVQELLPSKLWGSFLSTNTQESLGQRNITGFIGFKNFEYSVYM